ncbi:hypothetical protein DFH09DRAFT_1347602 [Mycena vulgaris]|nr:hypothetical protein DFH09DRAFT_1347602 [Mycena vulgaris]
MEPTVRASPTAETLTTKRSRFPRECRDLLAFCNAPSSEICLAQDLELASRSQYGLTLGRKRTERRNVSDLRARFTLLTSDSTTTLHAIKLGPFSELSNVYKRPVGSFRFSSSTPWIHLQNATQNGCPELQPPSSGQNALRIPSQRRGPKPPSQRSASTHVRAFHPYYGLSLARHVDAASAPSPPFGSNAPRLPSTMVGVSRRAQRASIEEVEDKGSLPPQVGAEYISAPLEARSPFFFSAPQSAVPVAAYAGPSPRTKTATLGSLCAPSSSVSELTVQSSDEQESRSPPSSVDARRDSPPHLADAGLNESRSIDLFLEPLSASVDRYHSAYNPKTSDKEDPLLFYGVIDGELPYIKLSSTMALRNAVIRYHHRNRNFMWEHLSDLVAVVAAFDAATTIIMPIADQETGDHYFGLNLKTLAPVADAVVAVQQILDAITDFLDRKAATHFVLDPYFMFTHMLERCSSRVDLRFVLSSLQLRLSRADVHIRSNLRSIWETLTGAQDLDQMSLVDSTISDVRQDFGTDHPVKELYKLLARPDYGR